MKSVGSLVLLLTIHAGVASGQQKIDARHVLGHEKCVKCHKSEVAAWASSSHAKKSFQMLATNPKAKEFAAKLNIPADKIATAQSLCTDCHGTRQQVANATHVLSGNSCESCHGASGPENSRNGWFTLHSISNERLARARKITEQQAEALRISACDTAGMNRVADMYDIARNCMLCHTVPSEAVVKAGHPTGKPGFEFVEWASGEVRHNFQRNQKVNAPAPTIWLDRDKARTAQGRDRMMFVLGKLADLEISLRNRGKATTPGFATAAAGRVAAANAVIGQVNGVAPAAGLGPVAAEVGKIFGILFSPPAAGQQEMFDAAADKVAALARKFQQAHNGNDLAGIDSMVPQGAKGAAHAAGG